MKRIVGLPSKTQKAGTNAPTRLNDIVKSADEKAAELDRKIERCDEELRKISQQLKSSPTSVYKRSLQDKARQILARKKRYEQESDKMREKSFNVDSLAMTISTAQDMKIVADAMRAGTRKLKKDLERIDLDKVETVQDELADLIDLTKSVEASIGSSYQVPEDIDDDELNLQLESLGDEIVADNDGSYIDQALQVPVNHHPLASTNRKNNGGSSGPSALQVDDFGLPILDPDQENNEEPEVNKHKG